MKYTIYFLAISTLIFSCSGDSDIKVEEAEVVENPIDTFEERVADIDKHSAILFSDSLNFNSVAANDLLLAYEEYIKHHSFEANSKDYQFKAGELAKALNKPHIAIKHFNDLLERDPKHEKAAFSLFYKAMIIGDMLHEDEMAIETYKDFIEQYPEHPFVESAKASIELQGKSLDEIVAGFEKKNS